MEDWVRRGFHTGDHVRGRKGDLLDFGKVVFGIAIEREFAERSQRNLLLRPDLGQVEDIPAELLCLLGGQNLQIAGPAGILAVLDAVEEILRVPVGVLGGHLARLLVVEGLAPLIGLAMYLDIIEGAIGLGEFVGMARVAVHVAIGVRRAAVREEVHNLVGRLLVGGQIVPEPDGRERLCFVTEGK